jgi:glycosyltransferase involved in cell wall biosynthesis
MRILHIIPRWIGGGPERHLLELARHDADVAPGAHASGGRIERRVLVLDRPLSAPLLVRARRLGLTIVAQPWTEVLDAEVEAADVVDVTYWNHPALLALLRRPLPPARIVICSAVAGDTLPQVIPPALVPFPDAWVLSAPPGHGARDVAAGHPAVVHVPALADMTRLDGFAPRPHDGVRVVLLGSLTAAKLHPGFARIVAAVARPDVTFDLYGDADPASVAQLEADLRTHGVADRVTLHGHVEQLTDVFAEADVFAAPLPPGTYVTSEKTLQEAMWVGVPPVLLEGTAAVGWIEPEVTGLVAADVATFAHAVDRLAADAVMRRRLGEGARTFARARFDPARNARALWAVVERCMADGKRERDPLPGADDPASERFLRSLGDLSQEFLRRVTGPDVVADPLLLRSEGGVLHHRNASPDDVLLDAWADVLLAAEARARSDGSR